MIVVVSAVVDGPTMQISEFLTRLPIVVLDHLTGAETAYITPISSLHTSVGALRFF